jgi:hypothetical protein
MLGFCSRPFRSRVWLALVPVVAWVNPAGSDDTRPNTPIPAPSAWVVEQPVALAVNGGHARFQVPTPDPAARTLVIVSALADSAGRFPTQMTVRGTSHVEPARRLDDVPLAAPAFPVPRLEPVAPPVDTLPPPTRGFHLLARDGDAASASNYLRIRGHLKAVGKRVQVYVDEADVARVGNDLARDLVATFDDQVFPVAARTIGQASDIDGDGRFSILVSSWLERLAGGRYAVDGFVRGADLDPSLEAPFSNRCDMMYLNASLRPGPYLRTIVAHEYTHAVTYSAKSFTGPRGERLGPDEEGWLDEAYAHLGEDLHGFSRANLDYRLSAFLSDPSRYRLVVDDYFTADLFRSHGNRGSTYLFLRWCADRYGPGLLPTLLRSSRRGVANLEAATGARFADLYRQWSIALFFNGLVPRLGGFHDIALRGRIGEYQLAGPRTSTVSPDGATQAWSADGTTTRYFVIDGSAAGGIDVDIEAPAESMLQVTAVPLGSDLPELELAARVARSVDGSAELLATLVDRGGQPVQLAALAWEPMIPPAQHSDDHAACGSLDADHLRAAFGASSLAPRGTIQSAPIALGPVDESLGPIVVKLLAIDRRGRRIAAWSQAGRDLETRSAAAGANDPRR